MLLATSQRILVKTWESQRDMTDKGGKFWIKKGKWEPMPPENALLQSHMLYITCVRALQPVYNL